jgi:hypothetical protein
MQVGFGVSGFYTLTASIQNACGTATKNEYVQVTGVAPPPSCIMCPTNPALGCLFCGGGIVLPPELNGIVYPNPASGTLYVDLDEAINTQNQNLNLNSTTTTTQITQNQTYDIRLYDSQGNIRRRRQAASGKIEFDVSRLPEGTYYLHIYDGINPKPSMQQIVVER